MSLARVNVNQALFQSLQEQALIGSLLDEKLLKIQGTPPAKTVTTTLTAVEVLTGLLTGQQGGAAAAIYTMPLGTALEAAMAALYPFLAVNDSFDFVIVNISVVAAETVTLAGNTGVTTVGKMLVPAIAAGVSDSSAIFRLVRTAPATFVVYRIG